MNPEKITRDAFLYLDPQGPNTAEFAQCETCVMFTGDRCIIHGPDVEVDCDDSCGLYIHGPKKLGDAPIKMVTPEESGLVDREVRCENCVYFDKTYSTCQLFEMLNRRFPKTFDLATRVNKLGCCNAQTPKPDDEQAYDQD
jgi:hypothetical protein